MNHESVLSQKSKNEAINSTLNLTPVGQNEQIKGKTTSFSKLLFVFLTVTLIVMSVLGIYAFLSGRNVLNNPSLEKKEDYGEKQTAITTQITQEPTNTTREENGNILSLNENWQLYRNTTVGYSIQIPTKAVFPVGGCRYSTDQGDHSYRPEVSVVPIKVFENGNKTYVTNEYYYELQGETLENSISYYSGCVKREITLDELKNSNAGYYTSPQLTIVSESASDDAELETFIKDNYGKDCQLGNKNETDQEGVFSVEIDGAVPISEADNIDCVVNYMYDIRYKPATRAVVAWNLGQACNFIYPPETLVCQDEKMSNSFRFE